MPLNEKLALDVQHGGTVWRGYMPLGGEKTRGRVDLKESFYFGPEHSEHQPLAGKSLHGRNQLPDKSVPYMRATVLAHIDEVMELGKTLTDICLLAMGFEEDESCG